MEVLCLIDYRTHFCAAKAFRTLLRRFEFSTRHEISHEINLSAQILLENKIIKKLLIR